MATDRRVRAPRRIRLAVGASAVVVLAAVVVSSAVAGTSTTLRERYADLVAAESAALGGESMLSLEQERDLLYRAYESLLPAEPETLRELDAEFEVLFAQLRPAASPDPSKLADTDEGKTAAGVPDKGIIDDGEDPPGFAVENRWSRVVGAREVTVFAGSWLVSPKQGDLVIFIDGEPTDSKLDLPSSNEGPLRITGALDDLLSLADGAGTEFTLELKEVVPTS
jgi:hypothetical protein